MDARYQPSAFEARIFDAWSATGVFAGDPTSAKPPFVIALPPPNITGELHMGHALNGSTQDTLIRLRRMQGHETLWICGTDHASIAVHAVIEKQLRAEGKTRWDLGRENFLERVWEWRATTGATIIQQFKRLGCSLDYDHERFTMDDAYVRAVLTMFVELYKKGYIYRDNRLINWCPTCASTISDLEVKYQSEPAVLMEVRYPIVDSDESIIVATVRPETIVADTAVAVNPEDERYRHLVGRMAIVPFVNREVPIIADAYVKTDFGTGVLKVTPGHDINDFEIGRRHDLAELSAIGYDGRMADLAGEFAGMTVADARVAMRDALDAAGLLVSETAYEHEVGHCDRTGDTVEPLISLQWFMHMHELAAPANAAVRSGRVRFHPKSQENTYFGWMDNLRPWCISRQLWWGHQIPVWYCDNGHVTVAADRAGGVRRVRLHAAGARRRRARHLVLVGAVAVCHASAGRTATILGSTKFYPGDVLSTARDIINLWVARMMMMGIEFMGDIPFTDVLIHSTIQAPDGRRMSKSLGTGIDPLELVDEFGADATRYGLLKMSSTQDVRFDRGAIEEGAKLANKLWNAVRFALGQAERRRRAGAARPGSPIEDRWIASRFDVALADMLRHIEAFDFSAASKALYAFVYDFCDWYIEALKPRLYGDDAEAGGGRIGASVGARADPAHGPPDDAVRDRGDLGAAARRAGAADAGRLSRARSGRRDDAAPSAVMDEVIAAVGAAGRAGHVAGAATGFEGEALVRRSPALGRGATGDGGRRASRGRRQDSAVQRATSSASSPGRVAERDRPEGCSPTSGSLAKAPPAKVEEERAKEARYAAEAARDRGPPGRACVTAADGLHRARSSCSACSSAWSACTRCSRRWATRAEFDAIHVVGTNGKTSTTRFAEALLEAEGVRTGAYTVAPHLDLHASGSGSGGAEIDSEAYEAAVLAVRDAAGGEVTQFEALTAAALVAFAGPGCEWAVVEAGLGGRLDATNVLPASRVVVLTNIELEHTAAPGRHPGGDRRREAGGGAPGRGLIVGEPGWTCAARARDAGGDAAAAASRIRTGRSRGRRSRRRWDVAVDPAPMARWWCRAGSRCAASARSRSGTAHTTRPACGGWLRSCRR